MISTLDPSTLISLIDSHFLILEKLFLQALAEIERLEKQA